MTMKVKMYLELTLIIMCWGVYTYGIFLSSFPTHHESALAFMWSWYCSQWLTSPLYGQLSSCLQPLSAPSSPWSSGTAMTHYNSYFLLWGMCSLDGSDDKSVPWAYHSFNSYSASHGNWCTETLWNRVITAQCEGMGEVGSARYEPALLPPCPSIRVLSYSNCQRSTQSHQQSKG